MRKITFALIIFALVGAICGQSQKLSQKPLDSSEKTEKEKNLNSLLVWSKACFEVEI